MECKSHHFFPAFLYDVKRASISRWRGLKLKATTNHSSSTYGIPVLVWRHCEDLTFKFMHASVCWKTCSIIINIILIKSREVRLRLLVLDPIYLRFNEMLNLYNDYEAISKFQYLQYVFACQRFRDCVKIFFEDFYFSGEISLHCYQIIV